MIEILEFWFSREEEASYGKPRQKWFSKNPEFDREMRVHPVNRK